MNRLDLFRRWLLGAGLVATLALSACGGGGSTPPPATIGAAGGTATGPAGAQVVVPAGALATATAVAVAQTSTGAPALPAGLAMAGSVFAFTPHGTTFAAPVTVTVPYDAAAVPATATPVLYKTNAAGGWDAVAGASFANGMASANVTSFSWVVVGLLPPQITQQPVSVSVQEPDTATFSVTALGAPPFSYQWQRSDNGGAGWVDIAGATTRTYTTAATSLSSDDGDLYRVIVGNPDGATTSAAATLTVTSVVNAPMFTTQPTAQTVAAGATATFTAVATGTNLVYRWQKNGVPIDTTLNPSAANASLSLTNVQAADAADYAVVVSNLIGGVPANSITSTAAHLTVTTTPPLNAPPRLAAGANFSAAVSAAGVPWSWGSDDSGTLGNGGADLSRSTATLMGTINAVVRSVAASSLKGAMLLSDGSALAWGYNTCALDGSTGATIFLSSRPVLVSSAFGFTAAAAGADHLLLVTSTGGVRATGCNFGGQLGYAPGSPAPATVAGLPRIVAVAAGGSLSLALDESGNVWSWGSGALGDGTAIGQPTTLGRAAPAKIIDRAGSTPVVAIAAGPEHALALTSDGTVLAWGRNTNGKLGDGTDTDRLVPTPTLIGAGSGVVAIAAGAENSVALRGSDGVVLSWGINETGQLGNGGTSPGSRFQPAPVTGLSGVVEVAFGSGSLGHGLARTADGSVWAWGHNGNGQLGNGSSAPFSATPVQVLSAPGVALNLN